ncbi:MAG TPA: hypothetical protein VM871_08150 [Flavisolibacter sp.]|jgi:ZIP family zinc transporter|nr:hypothetical protein [Flavisolibacter sp.]
MQKIMFLSIPVWTQALLWGLLSGSALVIGAALGYFATVARKTIGFVMGFGSGVLISTLAFDLMEKAYEGGGFDATAIGFLAGALIYTIANYLVSRRGAKHRKRSGSQQAAESSSPGSGMAIAIGALIDGIPESIVIGISMISGAGVSITAVVAIFLSNLPEGMSSSAGMKKAGRSARYIFSVWGAIALVSGIASVCGYQFFQEVTPDVKAAIVALAAGAILTMLSNTMMPEAFEEGHDFVGLVTVAGFLAAFVLTKLEG